MHFFFAPNSLKSQYAILHLYPVGKEVNLSKLADALLREITHAGLITLTYQPFLILTFDGICRRLKW